MLLELVLFFALTAAAATVAVVVPGLARAHPVPGLAAVMVALAAAARLSVLVNGDVAAAVALAVVALLATVAVLWWQPRWGPVSALLFAAAVLGASAYLVYAAVQTAATTWSLTSLLLSVALLVLEAAALALAVSYAFEVLDVLGRRAAPPVPPPAADRLPPVALQVPTYNEPVEVVERTLRSLAGVDYPDLLVQVVDNNTTDPALWRPLQRLCAELGPRFTFLHLEHWPGFKAGALNEATRRLPARIEIVGIVDADYVVHPSFLRRMVPRFTDRSVGFVQSSQHYRDWEDNRYLRGLFYSYRYFFDVTMPARDHRNAIIFCGTMGLIRRSALERIGGWDEAIITEDAEASLRMLGHGYRGVYDPVAYGAGLMPLSFDGLKKQRFRWALGGVQILRRHWRELVPGATHRLHLTRAQRAHYLLGSLQWFGDLLTAVFTVLLLLTAVATALHHRLPLRQLTGAVLVVPVVFLASGLLRALWAMRRTTSATWGDSVRALRVWFALSWVVALACLRGMVRAQAEFLRTPKQRSREGALRHALRASRTETVLAVGAVLAGAAMLVRSPAPTTAALAALLGFQALVYGSAPWAGVASEGITPTPLRRAYRRSPQSSGDRPSRRRAMVAVPAAAVVAGAAAVAAALVLTSPSDTTPFRSGQADLPTIGHLARGVPARSPVPTLPPTPSPSSTPTPTATPSATASPTASPAPSPTPTPTPASTPQPTP